MYEAFMKRLRRLCAGLPDGRKGGNNQHYALRDACLSAFGVFFTQSPSFLAYQREMRLRKGQDNAQSLFGVQEIPSDNHPGDVATETFDRELDYTLEENVEKVLGAIDAALRRIEDGTYGICADRGEQIDPERLEALPWTTQCIDCKRREERG